MYNFKSKLFSGFESHIYKCGIATSTMYVHILYIMGIYTEPPKYELLQQKKTVV